MGCFFGDCNRRRHDDFHPGRRPCDHCRPNRRFEPDRFDNRFCPGCRSGFFRFPRFF